MHKLILKLQHGVAVGLT